MSQTLNGRLPMPTARRALVAASVAVALALALTGCGKDAADRNTAILDVIDLPGDAAPSAQETALGEPASGEATQAQVRELFATTPDYPDQFRRGPVQFGDRQLTNRPPIAGALPQQAQSPAIPPPPPSARLQAPPPVSPQAPVPAFAGATQLASFDHSPFPFAGSRPGFETPFFNVSEAGRRGHRTGSGRVYWAHETYSERRSLLHVPEGFNPERPAVLVLFFHGHRARLERDIQKRYLIADQITASGMNAVIVAPQFAIEANDSSIGRFWEPGFMKAYLDEAADKMARMMGRPAARAAFERMPVIVIGYSGGFEPTGYALKNSGIQNRIRGVVLLDAAYGHHQTFADWMKAQRNGFFLSAYTSSTAGGNQQIMRALDEAGLDYRTSMPGQLSRGSAVFVSAPVSHEDYVTRAWAHYPIADLLQRLPDLPTRKSAEAMARLEPKAR